MEATSVLIDTNLFIDHIRARDKAPPACLASKRSVMFWLPRVSLLQS